MNKVVICIILPCIIALVASAYIQGHQGTYAQRNVGPYYNYATNSYQAVRRARLFNYLLGGLYFLNLFNITGNRIAG